MHDMSIVFLILSFLASAIVIVPIFHSLRISPIIGYMLAGIVLGPSGFSVVEHSSDIAFLADLGVIFLLFSIGLDLTWNRLQSLGWQTFKLGIGQLVICGLVFFVGAISFGQSLESSIIIGGSLALSSTALGLKLLTDSKEHNSIFGQMVIAILLIQDLAVVPIMTLTPLLHEPGMNIIMAMVIAIVKAIVAVIAIVFLGRFVLRKIYQVVSNTRNAELFTATTLFVLLGCSFITAQVGLSMALGAFLAGILLAETEYHHQVESDMHPFRGILLGLFFTTVGVAIDFNFVVNNLLSVFGLCLGIISLKACSIFILGHLFRFPINQSLRAGILLSQGGEFAFIVLGLALKENLLSTETGQILFGAIGVSLATTPLILNKATLIIHRILPYEGSAQLFPELKELKEHVILIGFGRIGQNIARLLEMQNLLYVSVDASEHVVAAARKNKKPVFFGDGSHVRLLETLGAEQAKVLIISIDDPRTSLRIAEMVGAKFPNTHMVIRAHDDKHMHDILQLKNTHGALETMEISIQISSFALEKYGFTDENIATTIEKFRGEYLNAEPAS